MNTKPIVTALWIVSTSIAFLLIVSCLRSLLLATNINKGIGLIFAFIEACLASAISLQVYFRFTKQKALLGNKLIFILASMLISSCIVLLTAFFNDFEFHIYLSIFDLAISMTYALLAAMIEETIFRGVVLDYLARVFGEISGLLISSTIFGLLHILNLLSGQSISFLFVLNTIIGGLLLGLIYMRFGLLSSIVVHASWNLCFNRSSVESSFATFSVLLIGTGFMLIENLKRKKNHLTFIST